MGQYFANAIRNAAIEHTGTGVKRAGPFRLVVVFMLAGMLWSALAQAQNVYRWKDADGKVHYTKALPPHAAAIPYDVLSPSGIVIERVTHEKPDPDEVAAAKARDSDQPKPLYSEAEKERIANNLLLLKYHSEDEIRDAMQVEVDQLKYDMRLLNADRASVEKSLQGAIHMAANRQRAGVVVAEEHLENIAQLRRRLISNEKARGRLAQREASIRSMFEAEMVRYRALIEEQESNS